MPVTEPLPIAKSSRELCLLPGLANRHGLITGATGTGKTVTLQTMAEALSSIGVPVIPRRRSWCSSSTKRICCSTMRRRR